MISQTLRRTHSAPPVLANHAPSPTVVSAKEAARLRCLEALSAWRGSDVFTVGDDRLCNRLLKQIDAPGESLDLQRCRRALSRVPAAVMKAFVEVRGHSDPALLHLRLPSGMSFVPAWLKQCPSVRSVALPGFKGTCADLSQLPNLESLALGELGWKDVKLVLPGERVEVTYTSPFQLLESRKTTPSGVCRLRLRLHNFNHATSIPGTNIEIQCRHIALATLGQWAALDWRGVLIDQQPLEALAWLHDVHQLESLVSLKMAKDFTRLNQKPKDAHIVAIDQWSDFVDCQGERMRARGRTHAFALMATPAHALALVFGLGSDGRCHVACLDPNFARHVRRASARDGLQALFVDFAGNFERYFSLPKQVGGPAGIVRVTFIGDPARPGKASTSDVPVLNLAFAGLPFSWHPGLVKDCLVTGARGALDALCDAMRRDGYQPPAEVIEALVWGQDDAVVWSHKAAEFGHEQVLRAWGACLLAAYNAGCLTQAALALALKHSPGWQQDNLLAVAVRSSHPGVVSCVLDLLGELHDAGALSAADVYLVCSFQHKVDAKLDELVRSRSVARALYRGWARLNKMGALSDEQRERLKDVLRPISHGWLPV